MKLNKPEITENQTELESYVAHLLKEDLQIETKTKSDVVLVEAERPLLKKIPSNVSNINQSKNMIQELVLSEDLKPEIKHKMIEKSEEPNKPEPEPVQVNDISPIVLNETTESSDTRSKNNEVAELKGPVEGEALHLEKLTQEIDGYSQREYKKDSPDPRLQGVEKLLAKISLASMIAPKAESTNQDKTKQSTQIQLKAQSTVQVINENEITLESASTSFSHREHLPLKSSLGRVFQTLVFEVNKLPLAVPLIKLGGIVNIKTDDITPLVGTPNWFMGLVPNERGNLMVIDTQQFLMPEKRMVESKEYQYLIILDDSQWALACHGVGDAKNLTPDDVRWSARSSKRPWFAGMVVEYMSALIEVDELINMLANNISD